MPFIGRDWRANGELWRKTNLGSWQHTRSVSLSVPYASLSDVFIVLDMIQSVTNNRRFHYITKLVQILFKEKLSQLSGNTQRYLFAILERMIENGEKTGDHLVWTQRILDQAQNSIQLAYPFYAHIGSSHLWQRHMQILEQMQEKLHKIRTHFAQQIEENKQSAFERLPIEMQYEILRRLDNGTDLIHLGMINRKLYRISQELNLWRELCIYHFNDSTTSHPSDLITKQVNVEIDWKKRFFQLQHRYGLKENYAEMINQCESCKNLFWQNSVHSCLYQVPVTFESITPRKLINMFT